MPPMSYMLFFFSFSTFLLWHIYPTDLDVTDVAHTHFWFLFVFFYLLAPLIFGLTSSTCDIIYILKQYTPTPSYLFIIGQCMDGIGRLVTPRLLLCVSLRAESIR